MFSYFTDHSTEHILKRRKKEARAGAPISATAQKAFGLQAKLLHAKRHYEKVQLKKDTQSA